MDATPSAASILVHNASRSSSTEAKIQKIVTDSTRRIGRLFPEDFEFPDPAMAAIRPVGR